MGNHHNILRINGNIQHYDWGGYEFLPQLLNVSNPSNRPFAEYWMGTHPKLPSSVINGDEQTPLSSYTQLPYLLKILDVKEMLSIQVHPSKKAAEIEFARENNERIPIDAPHRNYRDDNHKPELLVALGDFWLLHGFKEPEAIVSVLKAVPEFESLISIFDQTGYEGLYKKVMGMPQEQVNEMLASLIERIIPIYSAGVLKKNEEDHWAAKAALTFNSPGHIDRGIFSIYFFNLVKLEKGEGLFQPAGVPHAYLEGQCVEIMANSDNVLRGGLTSKHIDVKELMKHIICEPLKPAVLKAKKKGNEIFYETPAPDFMLSAIHLQAGEKFIINPAKPEIIIVVDGGVDCRSENTSISLSSGQAGLLLPGPAITLYATKQSQLYRANTPVKNEE